MSKTTKHAVELVQKLAEVRMLLEEPRSMAAEHGEDVVEEEVEKAIRQVELAMQAAITCGRMYCEA